MAVLLQTLRLASLAAIVVCGCQAPAGTARAGKAQRPPALRAAADPQMQDESASQVCVIGDGFTSQRTGHFVLMYRAHQPPAQDLASRLESTYQQFCQSLKRDGISVTGPESPLVWVCFDRREDFHRYAVVAEGAKLPWLDGYYSCRTNRVAMFRTPCDGLDRDPAATTHELAHQLAFNCGLMRRGVMYPLWLAEGLATNFEAGADGKVGFGKISPLRRERLLRLAADGRLMALDKFAVLCQAGGDQHKNAELYAQAWGLFNYLYANRRPQLAAYLKDLRRLPPGEQTPSQLLREFSDAFGDVSALQVQYLHFLHQAAQGEPSLASTSAGGI